MAALRGRTPKPKNELLRGGSRRAKNQPDDMTLPAETPNPPTSLRGEALAEWKRIVPRIKHALAAVDRAGLTAMCQAWAEMQALEAELASGRHPVASREWATVTRVRTAACIRWTTLAQRFGLTPADRARVKLPPAKDEPKKDDVFTPRIAGGA